MPAASIAAASATARFIPWPPGLERRDFIRIPRLRHVGLRSCGVSARGGPRPDLPPAGPPEVAFAGRSNVGKSSAINALAGRRRLALHQQDAGTHADDQFLLVGRRRPPGRPAGLRLRARAAARCACNGRSWSALICSSRTRARRRRADHGCAPSPDSARPAAARVARRASAPRAALEGGQALARRSKWSSCARCAAPWRRDSVTLFSSVTRQGVDECRDLLERWLQQAAEIKSPR